MDLGTARTIQKMIEAPSEADSILVALDPTIQEEIRHEFLTNKKLRFLFPELVSKFE
jgi:hypothetical protein